MTTLTKEGSARLEQIAGSNDVSVVAAQVVLDALVRGGGTQAQFSHPDLGGMGQWSRGGMTMVGDMFNNQLKTRVDQLCTEVSDLLRDPALFQTSPNGTAGASASQTQWWPDGLGRPSSSGSQDGSRYAYFPDEKRLAIEDDGTVHLYDTGDHRIQGVSQQQGGGRDLAFQSQNGTIQLQDLKKVEDAAVPSDTSRSSSQRTKETPWPQQEPASIRSIVEPPSDDIFDKIERLHDLQRKGILSEADFLDKKRELLSRI